MAVSATDAVQLVRGPHSLIGPFDFRVKVLTKTESQVGLSGDFGHFGSNAIEIAKCSAVLGDKPQVCSTSTTRLDGQAYRVEDTDRKDQARTNVGPREL